MDISGTCLTGGGKDRQLSSSEKKKIGHAIQSRERVVMAQMICYAKEFRFHSKQNENTFSRCEQAKDTV